MLSQASALCPQAPQPPDSPSDPLKLRPALCSANLTTDSAPTRLSWCHPSDPQPPSSPTCHPRSLCPSHEAASLAGLPGPLPPQISTQSPPQAPRAATVCFVTPPRIGGALVYSNPFMYFLVSGPQHPTAQHDLRGPGPGGHQLDPAGDGCMTGGQNQTPQTQLPREQRAEWWRGENSRGWGAWRQRDAEVC